MRCKLVGLVQRRREAQAAWTPLLGRMRARPGGTAAAPLKALRGRQPLRRRLPCRRLPAAAAPPAEQHRWVPNNPATYYMSSLAWDEGDSRYGDQLSSMFIPYLNVILAVPVTKRTRLALQDPSKRQRRRCLANRALAAARQGYVGRV